MPLGFDDRFRRLWEYYLAYCEAGFLSGNIDVRQVIFAKSAIRVCALVGLCARRPAIYFRVATTSRLQPVIA